MQDFGDCKILSDGTVQYRTDANLAVRFDYLPQLLEKESEEAGIPKYKDIEIIEFRFAGVKDPTIRKVKDEDKIRFKALYQQFKEGSQSRVDGTPLNQFPFIPNSRIKELEYFNIFTGEQLVAISDGNIEKLGTTGRDLIKKVKAYMESAKDNALVTRMTAENERLKREMDLLKEQMQTLMRATNEVESEKTKSKKPAATSKG